MAALGRHREVHVARPANEIRLLPWSLVEYFSVIGVTGKHIVFLGGLAGLAGYILALFGFVANQDQSASAMTGMPNLAKLFHTPDTTAASANSALPNPHERYMA